MGEMRSAYKILVRKPVYIVFNYRTVAIHKIKL